MNAARALKGIYNLLAGNRYRRRRLLALAAITGYMALLAAFSLAPLSPENAETSKPVRLINLLHIPAYAVLTFILIAYLRLIWRRPSSDWRVLALAFLITAGFGVLVEIIQSWIPGRVATAAHAALNIGGALWTLIAIMIFPTIEEMEREDDT